MYGVQEKQWEMCRGPISVSERYGFTLKCFMNIVEQLLFCKTRGMMWSESRDWPLFCMVPLASPVQETDDHVVAEAVWNAACRAVFVGVQLRQAAMPVCWSSLGVHVRDPALEPSLRRLARVDPNNPDVRARFAAILSDNMAVRYRTGSAARCLWSLRVTSRDVFVRDVIHLEHAVCTLYI